MHPDTDLQDTFIQRADFVLLRDPEVFQRFMLLEEFASIELLKSTDELGARAGLTDPGERAKAAAWLCWAVPLLLTEPLLQRRRFRRPLPPSAFQAQGEFGRGSEARPIPREQSLS